MFLNVDQLEKQLDKEEFQEIGSMTALKVLETQFQKFIKSRIYLDDEYVIMTRKYFLEYTQLEIQQFRDALIQHMESVKKSIDKRALHKREYDSRVNERKMLTTEQNVDTSKALDARTKSKKQNTSSSSENDADTDDADIKLVYDKGSMAENAEQCYDKRPLPAKLTDNQITELSNQSIENQSVVRQPTAFKSERPRISKQQFASQVDVKHVLSKLVTPHYLPKVPESAVVKPNHVIASSESRKSSKNMPRFSSNDMVHNHHLEEARKKTQEKRVMLFSIHSDEWKSFQTQPQIALRSYALSWKPCQEDSLNLPRYKSWCFSPIPAESDSLPHAHAQTTKTYYKNQDSRIKKAQKLKTKTSVNSDIQDLPLRYQVYQGRLLASFLDDAKYEHVGQDPRSQDGKDDKDKQGKDLKISESKTKSKDNDKG
ncbi:hypothetical protein Tco_0377529 [Tanacetum coccineum]